MKKVLLIIAIAVCCYFVFARVGTKTAGYELIFQKTEIGKPQRIVFYNDVTYSTKSHGIETISSSVFEPFYRDISRDLELNFGIIASSSARPLKTVRLQAFNLAKPIKPGFEKLSITQKAKALDEYSTALAKYSTDSSAYFANRSIVISEFQQSVDGLARTFITPEYRGSTDIRTAIDIADKAFNSNDGYANYLVLNSDGLDRRPGICDKLKNKATIVLINAGPYKSTCLDSLRPISFQSTDQAIRFILSQQNSTL